MKKILLLVLALGIVGAGIGYYMYNKPVASLERKKADVEVTADQLIMAYETDEKAADAAYLGKVVQVKGKVSAVAQEDGTTKIQLETSNPISLIICEMEESNTITEVKSGDEVTIKGMCSGYLSDVILVQSTLVKE
jgi:predicted extracellular nuclease